MTKYITNKYQALLWLIVISFSYEKPLMLLTNYDRFNPRLFDFALIIGIFVTCKTKSFYKDTIFVRWALIIFWFVICTIFGLVFYDFPVNIKYFMIFYLIEYIKGLALLFIFLRIPRATYSINTIIYPLIVGSVFVSFYCVIEYFIGIDEVALKDSLTFKKPKELVWGPFNVSYLHIANYLPLGCTILLSKFLYTNKNRVLWLVLWLFVCWPIFFTGSRTIIFLCLISFSLVLLFSIKKRKLFRNILLCVALPTFILPFTSVLEDNYTINRLQSFESGERQGSNNSIGERMLYAVNFDIEHYDQATYLPLFGGGFYVAPIDGNYRVSFGFHNIYIFALEQSGLIGLVLFLGFLIAFIAKTNRFLRNNRNDPYFWFVLAIFSYIISLFVIGWSGHTFWRGFATGNINTLRIFICIVVSCYISGFIQSHNRA